MRNKQLEEAIYGLENKFPQYSLRLFVKKYLNLSRIILIFFLSLCILFPDIFSILLFGILNCAYFFVQFFKFILIHKGSKDIETYFLEPTYLPIYSILLPLYKEDKVIKKLIQAIDRIDYPKNLLDVKLIIEEDDNKTLSSLKKITIGGVNFKRNTL